MSCINELDMLANSALGLSSRIWKHKDATADKNFDSLLNAAIDSICMAASNIEFWLYQAEECLGEYEACHKDDPVDVSRLAVHKVKPFDKRGLQ